MKKPIIGINPYYYEHNGAMWNATKEYYYQSIWNAGGIAFTLNYPKDNSSIVEFADIIDALLLVGGPDIPNKLYNGKSPELLDSDVMSNEREIFDRNIFSEMYKLNKPILAICVGMQHINIIRGGTLFEDLNKQLAGSINHGKFNGDWSKHSVDIDQSSILSKIINDDKIEVASTHHQGIRDLGSDLIPIAWSDDGLIEAIEDSKVPNSFIAVQWHPELMPNNINQKKLFSWLISEAKNRS
ncbi:MAG: gamma-glutamyl-gamma-aminobutyrate hydrolase family protein, partial [Candidatus Marinimicrobia bacterium]|nr:gamma-glutamyl-gamma-aminobutyrate hydrolase family protein [Candidatus Neomarinimicrobiota bacterium]